MKKIKCLDTNKVYKSMVLCANDNGILYQTMKQKFKEKNDKQITLKNLRFVIVENEQDAMGCDYVDTNVEKDMKYFRKETLLLRMQLVKLKDKTQQIEGKIQELERKMVLY